MLLLWTMEGRTGNKRSRLARKIYLSAVFAGASCVLVYAVFMRDIVLIFGQLFLFLLLVFKVFASLSRVD